MDPAVKFSNPDLVTDGSAASPNILTGEAGEGDRAKRGGGGLAGQRGLAPSPASIA